MRRVNRWRIHADEEKKAPHTARRLAKNMSVSADGRAPGDLSDELEQGGDFFLGLDVGRQTAALRVGFGGGFFGGVLGTYGAFFGVFGT